MKKVLIAASLAAIAFTSCQKERDCTCTTTVLGQTTTTVTTIPKGSKSDQKEACESFNGGVITCELD